MAKKVWLFFIYLIVALYTANLGFNLINLPDFFAGLNKWVLLIAGIFILFESFKYLKEYSTY